MEIIEKTLEDALIEGSKIAKCSVRELEYEIIQSPRAGFLGFFRKDAIIKIKIKKEIEKTILEQVRNDLSSLFCNEYFKIDKIKVSSANENTLNIEFVCDDYDSLIGKDACKYKALDTIINHYTNVKYGIYARVEIKGVLKSLLERAQNHINEVKRKIIENGKCQTKPLEISVINVLYEDFLKEFSYKNVIIKDNQAGSYIVVYGEFKKQ